MSTDAAPTASEAGAPMGRERIALAAIALLVVACLALAGLLIWPAFAALLLAGAALVAWSLIDPARAIWGVLILFCFEGTIKAWLFIGGMPFDADPRTTGALILDLILAVAVLTLVWRDRLRSPLELWRRSSTVERVVFALLVAWLALSVVQVFQTGDPRSGLEGFRLSQAYAGLALAGLIVFAREPRPAGSMLAVCGLLGGYALLRIVTGYGEAESGFVADRDVAAYFEQTLRAVGSFQSSVGLVSFATPALAFALTLGVLHRRLRYWALAVAAILAVVVFASYVRTPLLAVLLAVLFGLISGRDPARSLRPSARMVALGTGLVVIALGGAALAASTSPIAQERLDGLLNPGEDRSLSIRLETYGDALDEFAANPLGRGLGTVGRATEQSTNVAVEADSPTRTTDNSFLKVLLEQGILGILAFVAGVFGIIAVCARRLRRIADDDRAAGAALLAGFSAFVLLWMAGEYIEQPGKVIAWTMLGGAVALAFGLRRGRDSPAPAGGPGALARLGRGVLGLLEAAPVRAWIAWSALGLATVAAAFALTAAREHEFRAQSVVTILPGATLSETAEVGYWRSLLTRGAVWRFGLVAAGQRDRFSLLDRVEFVPDTEAPDRYLLSTVADTPAHAAELAERIGYLIDYYSGKDAGAAAQRRSVAITALGGEPPERLLRVAVQDPAQSYTAPATTEPLTGADRLIDGLPGPFPRSPGLAWALAMGLLIWGAACLIWNLRLGPRAAARRSLVAARPSDPAPVPEAGSAPS